MITIIMIVGGTIMIVRTTARAIDNSHRDLRYQTWETVIQILNATIRIMIAVHCITIIALVELSMKSITRTYHHIGLKSTVQGTAQKMAEKVIARQVTRRILHHFQSHHLLVDPPRATTITFSSPKHHLRHNPTDIFAIQRRQ